MPVDSSPIAARLKKPGDLRHPVADRDQKHPTVSAATQANARDLAKWYVDHAAHSQPVLGRLTVSMRESLRASRRTYNHCLRISRVFCSIHFENGNAHSGMVPAVLLPLSERRQGGGAK